MPLTKLGSSAVMLQLMSFLLHFVALFTPAWIQLGVFVPVLVPKQVPEGIVDLDPGHMDGVNGTAETKVEYVLDLDGPRDFVKVQMGVWEWCQHFQRVSPSCQEPDFLGGVGLLGVIAMVTLPLALVLLLLTACTATPSGRKRVFSLLSLLASACSAIVILLMVAIYAILSRREVSDMLSVIGEDPEPSYLGWGYGAQVVCGLLITIAAIFICVDRIRTEPKPNPQFQLVA